MITVLQLFFVIIIIVVIGIWRYLQNYIPTSPLFFKLKPSNTAFAFDLHGVIVSPDIPKIISILWYEFPKKIFFWLLVSPSMWPSLFKLARGTMVPEEFFDFLLKKYPQFQNLETSYIKILNSQKLNCDTFKLIIKLKNKGYPLFLASNINPRALEGLQKKIPELATLFDGIFIPRPENNYVSKPRKEFFEGLKKSIDEYDKHARHILFVDNYLPNIKGAYLAGLNGVTFNTAQQLLQYLTKSGLS